MIIAKTKAGTQMIERMMEKGKRLRVSERGPLEFMIITHIANTSAISTDSDNRNR